MSLHFHIYCTIVDNFGDIGVCWRLARQLVNEHGCAVTLWVDDWTSARQLIRELPDQPALTLVGGVSVDAWAHVHPAHDVTGDVLIEGFACALPAVTLAQLAARPNKPVWVNLDYFSAEDWIPSFHGLSGYDADAKATRWFFFPGVHANSGGILREADLLVRRDRWLAQPPADTAAFLAQWGLALPQHGLTMLCFAYQHAPYAAWLDAISSPIPPTLWLCGQYSQAGAGEENQEPRTKSQEPRDENQESRTKSQESRAMSQELITQPRAPSTQNSGLRTQDSGLRTYNVPFVAQEDFDRLLWCADVLWVRGEDSLARALWAGKPFVWHIYPQAEQAHHAKLQAWLRHYAATFPAALQSAYVDVHLAWNGVTSADALPSAWRRLMAQWAEWQAHSRARSAHCAQAPDLASRLMDFVTK